MFLHLEVGLLYFSQPVHTHNKLLKQIWSDLDENKILHAPN